MSNIFVGLKKACKIYKRIKQDNDNETCLKEGGGIEMSTTVLFYIRDARFEYLLYSNVHTVFCKYSSNKQVPFNSLALDNV